MDSGEDGEEPFTLQQPESRAPHAGLIAPDPGTGVDPTEN